MNKFVSKGVKGSLATYESLNYLTCLNLTLCRPKIDPELVPLCLRIQQFVEESKPINDETTMFVIRRAYVSSFSSN